MYRILIADDEPNIREGLADLISQRAQRWEVAAVACDGLDALEKARQTLPDAILSDICMPHMNGLDFLENLLAEMPDTKLLVLSGYDQFDYAVQALRIGVSDFLLKPLETFRLLEVLDRLANELDEQAVHMAKVEELNTRLEKDNHLRLERYFQEVLLGVGTQESPAKIEQAFAGANYCCVLCDEVTSGKNQLDSLFQQRLDGDIRMLLLRMGMPAHLVLVFWTVKTDSFFLNLHHILSSVAVQNKKSTGRDIHFFLGQIVDEPKQLRVSYRQSIEAKNYAFPEQAPTIMTYKETLERSLAPCPQIPEQLEKDITAAVKCGNEGVFFQCCNALFQWIRSEDIHNAVYTRMCVLSLCYAILRDNRNIQKMSYYEFVNFQKEIMAAGDLEELRTLLENFARFQWINQRKASAGHATLTQRVEAIVEENLDNIDFSLDVVAGQLYISPNYLRQLFKEESGQTFTEFLTAKRMLRAKMLLGNPKMRVGDAAEQCGYADPRYFSSCFKKYWHLTPSEYQLMAQQGSG